MWQNFRHLTRVLSRNNPRTTSRRPRVSTRRPQLEALEDRCLLSAGVLDPTFGNGAGYVTASTTSGSDAAHTALIQPDGKIVAVGSSVTPDEFAVERYNPDGSLDTSFGSGGIVIGPAGRGPRAALYPQAGTANDGKIVQLGRDPNGQYQVLVRYNTNGTLDATFGTGGVVMTAFPGAGFIGLGDGVVLTSGGQLVAESDGGAGHVAGQVLMARYNPDGSLDTTFGQGGEVITSVQQAGVIGTPTLLQQADGKLIAVTATTAGGGGLSWELIRYNANGSLDTSFGNQGIVTTFTKEGLGSAVLYPSAGTPNDGKIVVAGISGTGGAEIARYNPDGSLDTTFGTGGDIFTPFGGTVGQVTLDASGRIVVVGSAGSANVLARFNVNGTPDTTFGSGGVVTTTFGTSSQGLGVALYPNAGTANDGKLVVVGSSNNGTKTNVLVARYLGDSAGFAVTGFPSSITAGTAGTFTVTATNADGSTNSGYTGTVHFTSSDPKAVLPADYTFTAADQGVHTFSATLKRAGSQSITATDTGTSTLVGGESGILVQPAAASQFILSAPSSVSRGSKFSLTVTVEDAFGNVVTGYVGTVHFTSSDGTATLPMDYTFTAGDAGVHTFVSKATLRKRGKQTVTVTDTQNSALTATDSISVT
jgi:uncharacterized delta-60 repeat protein